jgi:diaminohydroxyphosphoribosylaminopyrimidine deaminase/5-amino-6-(5-phosphoribosylamino)uracil reductase
LRRAGLQVDVGCLAAACREQNKGFFRFLSDGRPHVTLKAALTLDGFIAIAGPAPRRAGRIPAPTWITGPAARRAAHALRAAHDAVLVGAGTVLADNPRLNVRLPGRHTQPLRVVLDGRLRISPEARLFSVGSEPPPLIVGVESAGSLGRARRLERAGADVVLLPADRRAGEGKCSLTGLLRALSDRCVQSVLVEGGSHILGAFVEAGLVDSVAWFIAPRFAGAGVPVVAGSVKGGRNLAPKIQLGTPRCTLLGDDVLITADVTRRPG